MGYNAGGLEIIADADEFRVGQTASVLITAPTSGRSVLFTIERNGVEETQLIRLEGTSKLMEIPIMAHDVPNIFLSAETVFDARIFGAVREIVVPPVERFLSVEIKTDRAEYQPRQRGVLTITTRDAAGNPVSAEVSVGLTDEAVACVQEDYADDPRKFFYGDRRSRLVRTSSSFGDKAYAKRRQVDPSEISSEANAHTEQDAGALGYAWRDQDRSDVEIVTVSASLATDGRDAAALQHSKNAPVNGRDFSVLQSLKEASVQVRSDFRATAFWRPSIVTDANGQAMAEFSYPDSLTTWKAVARAASQSSEFGIGEAKTRTKQPLIVRLQAPRFFVVGDMAMISAVINNNTDSALTVGATLNATGCSLAEPDGRKSTLVKANGETRIDWTVSVSRPGAVKFKIEARGGDYADATEISYPIYDHGIEKFIAQAGKTRNGQASVTLDLPQARNADATTMTVRVTPSLAATMLDAIPYLIDYPYGCIEQTMSRFLPAAVIAKTLRDQGLKPEDVAGKVFGGVEPTTANQTHPETKRNTDKLDDVIRRGLDRIYDFQHDDDGWGWWNETATDHFMTGYVVWGLSLAKGAGVDVRSDVLDRGAEYLVHHIVEFENALDDQAWTLHALASWRHATGRADVTPFETTALENLWRNRNRLTDYGRSLFAVSAQRYGEAEKAMTLIRNLENGVRRDDGSNGSQIADVRRSPNNKIIKTAHWGEERVWRRWSEGGVETTAFALQALLAIDPKNALVEPAMNWLVKNRRGAQWSNTRDTAISLLALNECLKTTKETANGVGYAVSVNGHQVVKRELSKSEAFSAPSRFIVPRELIHDGANVIEVVRTNGDGTLYFSAESAFLTLENPIAPAGNEIFVRRRYFRLSPRSTLLNGVIYDRVPLNDGEEVTSGERLECAVTIETKNDCEYLLLEDLKPAGLEAVEVRSGELLQFKEVADASVERSGRRALTEAEDYTERFAQAYQELRDRKITLFVDKLPQGVWEARYELRAETPGRFHALPVLGHAMYVPEIRCNSAEQRMTVRDRR